MKNRGGFRGIGRFVTRTILNDRILRVVTRHKCWAVILSAFIAALSARGQAPAMAWSTNVGAILIGSDAQTNVYAELNSESIITISSTGAALQTNHICPFPGLARRDAAGNFYFAGTINPPVNFGGGIIVSNSLCAIAKFNSSGNIIWAQGFSFVQGTIYNSLNVSDLEVDPSGVAYVTWVARFDEDQHAEWTLQMFSDATNWSVSLPSLDGASEYYGVDARVTPTSATTGYALTVANIFTESYVALCSFSNNAVVALTNWAYPFNTTPTADLSPISDGDGNVYNAENTALTKRTSAGTLIWAVDTGDSTLRCVANDFFGGVHVADDNGMLARYDSAGNLAWTTNLPSRCNAMICDAQGNRFISRNDGVISRMQSEAVLAPVITNAPVGGTIFAGSNFTFSVGASGFTPFNYYWQYQTGASAPTNPVPGGTNATLTLTGVTAGQSGLYSVIVSNSAGSVTSAPVTLSVKSVEVFYGTEMLSGGSYSFPSPPTLTIRSAFSNGEVYYTLDGSTPSFLSTPYTGPFVLTNSATINAIGYSSDFSQSAFADAVIATVPPQYTLTVSTAGGGSISLTPPGGSFTNASFLYGSNTVVTATAVPAAGFSLLGWQGAATGNNPTVSVTMNQAKSLTAVFGTTLSTTVAGNGQIGLAPPGGLYAYGATVRLEALPQSGNFFGAWGNAASGSSNPLYFTITNPTPTVSSIFSATPSNEAALTVLIIGQGTVGASPAGNVFPTNQSVTLTATPAAGQSFIHWSGDISSTSNPVTVVMTQSRLIKAVFTGGNTALSTTATGMSCGMTSQGFKFAVLGDPESVCQILSSSDLVHWSNLMLVTNSTGETPVLDSAATNSRCIFYRGVLMMP